MGSLLSWQIDDSGEVLRVVFVGQLTERAVFTELLERPEKRIDIDLCEVRRFTSAGIREWVKFVTKLKEDRDVGLVRCSVATVQQLNMIANMHGGAAVRSVMVPYNCPDCDQDHEVELTLAPDRSSRIVMGVPCPECNGPMDFDEIADSFLAFYLDPE